MSRYSFFNQVGNNKATIYIIGPIDSWYKNSANSIRRQLSANPSMDLEVVMSTEGGSVNEGMKIYDMFRSHKGKVTMKLSGLCASIGTVISLSADHVVMSKQCAYMVHRVWGTSRGNADELKSDARGMEIYEEQIIDIYARKTGQEKSFLNDLIKMDTWLGPQEALELGFVDEVVDYVDYNFSSSDDTTTSVNSIDPYQYMEGLVSS